MPAHITFPRRGFVRVFAALQDNPPADVKITQSETGWMREETAHHWLDEVLSPYVTDNETDQFLLIVDHYRVHRTENFRTRVRDMRGSLDYVPAGCTSLVQPLDVAVMKSFKCHVRRQWKSWKKDHTDERGDCPHIGLRDVTNIIRDAWDGVDEDVIVN